MARTLCALSLMFAASVAHADERKPPTKDFFALVAAYIGTGMDSKPGVLVDVYESGAECAVQAALLKAKYQADTRFGDFATLCFAISLTPSARTQS